MTEGPFPLNPGFREDPTNVLGAEGSGGAAAPPSHWYCTAWVFL